MASSTKKPTSIIVASVIIVGVVVWLAFAAAGDNKSYYVTIAELQGMGSKAYTRHLRVAGNVKPGSIERVGTTAHFALLEKDPAAGGKTQVLEVSYQGTEPPPDTFKDDSQALAIGTYGRDGVFHATQLQAKCASKYAPAPGARPGQPVATPADAAPKASASLEMPAR
jgi:cytochrome c-type biogenesis protein CcmE